MVRLFAYVTGLVNLAACELNVGVAEGDNHEISASAIGGELMQVPSDGCFGVLPAIRGHYADL